MGGDSVPLKPLNVDGQAKDMKPFPCLLDTLGTHNSSTKEVTTGNNITLSNGTMHISYANRLNIETSKKVAIIRTLFAPIGNGVGVAISMESVLKVTEHLGNSVYRFSLGN